MTVGSWQAPQEFEGIFFVQPNKQDKPNKRIRLAGHAGSRFEVSVTPPTIPHSPFPLLSLVSRFTFPPHVPARSAPYPFYPLTTYDSPLTPVPNPLPLSATNSEPRTQNFFARPPLSLYPLLSWRRRPCPAMIIKLQYHHVGLESVQRCRARSR